MYYNLCKNCFWVDVMKKDINCIILCAGKGSRMNCETKNKVCFEIMDKPAVVRVIENLRECGVEKFVVVVGSNAESVMNTVSGMKGVTFAFQKEQLGTGNAAMCGLKILDEFGIDGPILTVMGDKLIDKSVFKKLIDDFYTKQSDVSFITQPSDFNTSGGKIVIVNNKVIGIVEHMDLLLLKAREELKKGKKLLDIYFDLHFTDRQISKLDSKLKDNIASDEECYIEINGIKLSSEMITKSNLVNCATYLYNRKAISASINGLRSDNAQNEIYFTDTIMNIAKDGIVSYVTVPERNLIHTFNTLEELEEINNYFKEEGING